MKTQILCSGIVFWQHHADKSKKEILEKESKKIRVKKEKLKTLMIKNSLKT